MTQQVVEVEVFFILIKGISRSSVGQAERRAPGGVGIVLYELCCAAKSIATDAPHTDVSSSHTQQRQDKEAQGKGGTAGCHDSQDRQGL